MDYEINNKFSDALIYAKAPCDPIPTRNFIKHLNEGIQILFLEDENKRTLRARKMYMDCLSIYLESKKTQAIVPNEAFFKNLWDEFKDAEIFRKEVLNRKTHSSGNRRRFVKTITFLIDEYFYPQKIVTRPLKRLVNTKSPHKELKLTPISKEFSRKKIISTLHKANESVTSDKKIFQNRKTHIGIFDEYLKQNNITSFVPDETFFLKYFNDLENQPLQSAFRYSSRTPYYSESVKQKTVREVRTIINQYFYSKKITKRKILLDVEWQRYERFLALTKNTQRAITWFENNGKYTKAIKVFREGSSIGDSTKYIHQIEEKKLLPKSIYGKVNHVLNFLNIVGKNGIEQLNDEDLRKFEAHCDKKGLSQKQDYLAHITTFFINAQAEDFITDHPFKQTSLKMNGTNVRVDFVSQEGINRLFDIKIIDLRNPVEVRNALACALAYDLGLRVGEIYGLNVSDICKDAQGDTYIRLDKSIQKGKDKPEGIVYPYFDPTQTLLDYYLKEVRPSLNPKDTALILSIHSKKRLGSATLKDQMPQYMEQKGVKTFYGKKATAHHLRHSMGTLNSDPLGAGWSLDYIVERYRHVKHETAKKHYIHNNPCLQKLKHAAMKTRMKKKSNQELLHKTSLSDLETFFIDDLRLDPETMKEIRRRHKNFTLNRSNVTLPGETAKKDILKPFKDQEHKTKSQIASIGAEEVRKKISMLGVNFRAFVAYCQNKEFYVKRGRDHYFVDTFIEELEDEWVTKEEVMEAFNLHRRRFYRLLEEKKWPTIKIGNVMLLKLKKLVQSTRDINRSGILT